MESLSKVTRALADLLDAAAGAEDARSYSRVLDTLVWPSGLSPEGATLRGDLRADLDGFLAKLATLSNDRALRNSLARLAGRYRQLGERIEKLADAGREIEKYQDHVDDMPPRDAVDRQLFATETIVDTHRMQVILLRRSEIRAQVQREHIRGTLSDYDPREKLAALEAELHVLELDRLMLIRASEEPRRGLDLQIQAAQAMIEGDRPRAEALRKEAQRRYQESVALSKHGALAPLRPIAERTAAGLAHERKAGRAAKDLERLAKWAEDRTVFIAGSTHTGDEVAVASAFARFASSFPRPLLLVLAPREPERASEIKAEISKHFASVARLKADKRTKRPDVVLIDVAGILVASYAVADGAFVGGGRAAVRDHNFCEPLAYGIATYTTRYRQWAPERWELLEARAPELVEVVTPDQLEEMAQSFLQYVNDGVPSTKKRDRAARFLPIARDAERDALATLEALGDERIQWLERIRDKGAAAWAECPHRAELLELGLLLGPRPEYMPLYRHSDVLPAMMTSTTKYLLAARRKA